MKLIILTLSLVLSTPCLAAKRPGLKDQKKIETPKGSQLSSRVSKFNTFLKDTLNIEVEIKAPENMLEKEQGLFIIKIDQLQKALEGKRDKYTDSIEKNNLSILLKSFNDSLVSRSSLKDMLETTKDLTAQAALKEMIQLIDNGPTIIKAKVTESSNVPVSEGLIVLTFDTISSSIKKSKLTPEEILAIKVRVEEPFKNEKWTIWDIAKCR